MIDNKDLPSTTGVYIFKKGNIYLYVGKSVNIKARVKSHFENSKTSIKEKSLIFNTNKIDFIITDSEFNALLLEAKLIQKYHPKYNVIWKDNKSYLYIKITVKEKYPKVLLVRKENDKKSLYFGPFGSVKTAGFIIKEIRRLIPFCTQKKISKKLCFYSKIGLCSPCPNYIEYLLNDKNKEELLKKYKSNINKVINILKGNIKDVIKLFYTKLKTLIKKEKYEEAIIVRNKIFRFEQLLNYNWGFDNIDVNKNYNQSEKNLKDLFITLKSYFPSLTRLERIECYDVSNLYGKLPTASMVVLSNGLVAKSEYRRFKIKNQKAKSDIEMIEEVLRRRFKKNWKMPDLIVIDGGKPQLKKALKVFSELNIFIPVIGIAKNPDRLIIGSKDRMPTLRFLANNQLNLIKLIRDESHRFAHKYHLLLRDKNFMLY